MTLNDGALSLTICKNPYDVFYKVSPNVHDELKLIRMYQYCCHQCTALMQDVHDRETVVFVLFVPFFYEPRIALNNS